jgi:hypothetical protein
MMTAMTDFLATRTADFPRMEQIDLDDAILAKLTGNDDSQRNVVWADRLAAYDPGEIEAFDVDDEVMGQIGVAYGMD